jgi:adenylate cyclase
VNLRRKIVSLIFTVLLVFAATVAYSLVLQHGISERFDAVVDYHIPLNRDVAAVDVLTDRYELDLLRLDVEQSGPGADAALLARGETRRRQQGAALAAAFAQTEALLDRAIADRRAGVDNRLALARIKGQFGYMARALPDFIDVGRQMVAAMQAGHKEEASAAIARFTRFRDLFGQDLSAVRQELAHLTQVEAAESATMQRRMVAVGGVMVALASMLGISLALVVSNRMMVSLHRLIDGAQRMRADEAYEPLPVTSKDEIGVLTRTFNLMAADLLAKDRIKETFGTFVDPRVVANLIDGPDGEAMAERQVATVFFSDIKGFSSISEMLTASTMVKLLNTYFSAMADTIHSRHGIIDKYIGDSVMAFWTPPFSPGDTHAAQACLSALAQQAAIEELKGHLSEILGLRRNIPEFSVRMGLASGELVLGTVGSPRARSFTVIGDTANLASRLEGANKAYGTRILCNEDVYRLAQQEIEAREIDSVIVLGKIEPVRIYEVMAVGGGLTQAQEDLRGVFAEGLAAYRGHDWDRAEDHFARCLAITDDGPAMIFRERVKRLRGDRPAQDWDGVWRLQSK